MIICVKGNQLHTQTLLYIIKNYTIVSETSLDNITQNTILTGLKFKFFWESIFS